MIVIEKDIYNLAKIFFEFPNHDGMISINQLLQLKEFKHCPFKRLLPRAFGVEKIDSQSQDKDKYRGKEENVVIHSVNSYQLNGREHGFGENKPNDFENLPLISFKQFCEMMKYFSPNCPNDSKIECIIDN